MSQFLHIAFNWRSTLPTPTKTWEEKVFANALDWMRYAPNCWIVYTSSDTNKWMERIKPYLKNEDYVFISKIELANKQGWLPKWCWEWLDKKR